MHVVAQRCGLRCSNVAGMLFSQRCKITTLYNVVLTLCVCWVRPGNKAKPILVVFKSISQRDSIKGLKIIHINTRSVFNKLDELKLRLSHFDIIVSVFEIKGAPCTLCAHFGYRVHRFKPLCTRCVHDFSNISISF